MRFSCDRCGQRYSSADEPEPGHSYRVLCLACGGTVLLKGGEFPALPTFAADAAAAQGQARPEAAAEEPVVLVLAPTAQQEPAPGPHVPRMAMPGGEPRFRRWSRFVVASGVALATAGAGVLLFTGGPSPEPRGEARVPRGTSETAAIPAGTKTVPDPDGAATARTAALPAPLPQDRQRAPAVVAPDLPLGGPGPDRPAALSSSTMRTVFPPAAKPAQASPANQVPSPVAKAPAATRLAAVPQEPRAASAPTSSSEPTDRPRTEVTNAPPMAMAQPKPVQEEIELPDPNEPKKGYGGGEAGAVAGGVAAAQGRGVEEAPQYVTTGFKPPRLAKKTCLAENTKMTGDVAALVTGPVTVKFAVYANGTVGAIQILSPVDPRVTNAIKRSIAACEWVPGSDAEGRAAALWVIQPFRIVY